MSIDWDVGTDLDKAEVMVRKAAKAGAEIILLQELFATVYFCPEQHPKYFDYAHETEGHPFLGRFADLARELGVVLPISFFEKSTNAYFNSVMMIDADGTQQGVYRKTHIPQGPGYEEKFYFNPGDLGFGSGIQLSAALALASAGISGFPKQHDPWRSWGPTCCFTPQLSVASPVIRVMIPQATGSGPCRGMPQQIWWRLPPATELAPKRSTASP